MRIGQGEGCLVCVVKDCGCGGCSILTAAALTTVPSVSGL